MAVIFEGGGLLSIAAQVARFAQDRLAPPCGTIINNVALQ